MIISSTFNICEICGIERSKRVHSKCSKILQKRAQDPKQQAEYETIRRNARNHRKTITVQTNRINRIRAAHQRVSAI